MTNENNQTNLTLEKIPYSRRLDGLLLAANGKIDDVGSLSMFFFIVIFLMFAFLAGNGLVVFGLDFGMFSNWFSYLIILGILFVISIFLNTYLENRVFQTQRREIYGELASLDISREDLISHLEAEDDDSYGEILEKLKLDNDEVPLA